MKKASVILLAVCVMLMNAQVGLSQQPTAARDKIARDVRRIGLNGRVTVTLASNAKVYGEIKNIENGSFYVSEVERINLAVINYDDAKKVHKGYCEPQPFIGSRSCPSKRSSLIAGAAVIGGIILALVVFIPKT